MFYRNSDLKLLNYETCYLAMSSLKFNQYQTKLKELKLANILQFLKGC